MGKLKNFVNWSQKKFILKYVIAFILIIISIFGIVLPILQGIPLLIIAILILIPNKKLSKKIFKHEKLITYSLIIGFSILLIIPAILYGYGIFRTGFVATYSKTALDIMQIGQQPIRTAIQAII